MVPYFGQMSKRIKACKPKKKKWDIRNQNFTHNWVSNESFMRSMIFAPSLHPQKLRMLSGGDGRVESGTQGERSIDQAACQHSSSRMEDVIRMIKAPPSETHEDAANR